MIWDFYYAVEVVINLKIEIASESFVIKRKEERTTEVWSEKIPFGGKKKKKPKKMFVFGKNNKKKPNLVFSKKKKDCFI